MSVRRVKRDSGYAWIVDIQFEHADGRVERVRKVSPVQTKRGAEEYERQIRGELLQGPRRKQKEVPTFESFVDDRWWPVYPSAVGNRRTTVREKEIHIRVHLKPLIARRRLDEIRGEVVDRMFADLKQKGLGPKTIKNVSATLRRILASAVEWDVIDVVPKLPKIKVTESPFDFFVMDESDKLLAAARNPEERLLLLFALHTGARAGEELAFEWADIDWHNAKVIFRRSSTRGHVGPTKTGRERKVPLTKGLAAGLKAHKHLRSPLVFCNEDGRPLTLWQLHERLEVTCKRAGLRRVRWHDLRHSFASQLVIAGVPIRQVQEWMGHSTITMTMRYSHLAPGAGADLIGVLDRSNGTLTALQKIEIASN